MKKKLESNLNDPLVAIAKRRVYRKKKFQKHLSVYLIINAFLFAIYRITTPHGYPWFIWPLVSWGVGLALQYASIYGIPGITEPTDEEWERKQMELELQRLGRRPPTSAAAEDSEHLPLKPLEQPLPKTQPSQNWTDEELV